MSKSKESRALFRIREQARRSRNNTSKRPHIIPVTLEAMAAFASHVAALAEQQPLELNLFSLVELFDSSIDPALHHTAREWMRGVARGTMPICLCCDTQWLSFGEIPPAGFAVVCPFNKEGAAVCSGLCVKCFHEPHLLDRCVDRYRLVFGPGLFCQGVSPSTDRVQ